MTDGRVGRIEAPATAGLLVALLACYVAQQFALARYGRPAVEQFVAHSERLYWVWTWATQIFLHANATHLFLNATALYLFGRSIENRYGSRALVIVFLATGVATAPLGIALGVINACGLGALQPGVACGVSVAGASTALCGLLGFMTRLRPSGEMYVIPASFSPTVPLWAFTGGFLVLSVLGMYTPFDPLSALVGLSVMHHAHVVGIAVGVGLATVWQPTPTSDRTPDAANA